MLLWRQLCQKSRPRADYDPSPMTSRRRRCTYSARASDDKYNVRVERFSDAIKSSESDGKLRVWTQILALLFGLSNGPCTPWYALELQVPHLCLINLFSFRVPAPITVNRPPAYFSKWQHVLIVPETATSRCSVNTSVGLCITTLITCAFELDSNPSRLGHSRT